MNARYDDPVWQTHLDIIDDDDDDDVRRSIAAKTTVVSVIFITQSLFIHIDRVLASVLMTVLFF